MHIMEAIDFMDDFFLRSGSKYPTLMELPFAKREIKWERAEGEKMYVHGNYNGVQELSVEIDLWKLKLPLVGKPKFLVRQVAGSWMELHKPRDFYLETMKVVLVAAYFLIFAKQSPNSSKGDVWRYVRKECREFKVKPNHRDLVQAFLLLQSIVLSDPVLQASPIIPQFFPILSKNRRQEVVQGGDHTRKTSSVQRESSSIVEALTPERPSSAKKVENSTVELTPPTGENLKGGSSLQSTPRMRSLADFAAEADLPLLVDEPSSKKRKAGRPPGSLNKKGNKNNHRRALGDDDWVDEPDVCAFCDDGVEEGEKLLCCDGRCMRSFHPTVDSGIEMKCPTLCLSKSVVSVKSWMCPNCEASQHQCFACGKLGNSETTSDFQEVFECDAKQCKRFYHSDCVAKLLVPVAARKNVACSIQLKSDTFICPLHKCASCQLDEDKTNPDLCLIKCRRCPTAWHEKCLPEVCRNQLWPLEGGKHVMYCGQHKLDPELLTPKRDHVLFPAPQEGVYGKDQKQGLHSVALRKPSPGSYGSTRQHQSKSYQRNKISTVQTNDIYLEPGQLLKGCETLFTVRFFKAFVFRASASSPCKLSHSPTGTYCNAAEV